MKRYLSIGIAAATMLISLPAKASVQTSQTGASTVEQAINSVLEWNKTALQAVQNVSFAPPATSRALAILQTSIFDAWSAYDPLASSTQSAIPTNALRTKTP
jgi:hypothetical protein